MKLQVTQTASVFEKVPNNKSDKKKKIKKNKAAPDLG